MFRVLFALLLATASHALTIGRRGFDYSSDKVRGVNLGGWLVLESWITPSLFSDTSVSDEWSLCETLGQTAAAERLTNHYNTFINESDFSKIAGYGFNAVRIPIGYWAFNVSDGEPFVQGQEAYLDSAISWANNAGLKVWIDLHGAPGSQNGFDNSGKKGDIGFQKGNTVDRTVEILEYIIKKYTGSDYVDTVIGIETLNEPLASDLDLDGLKEFNAAVYSKLYSTYSNVATVFHDGYISMSNWNDGMVDPSSSGIVMDTHQYFVFSSNDCNETFENELSSVCTAGNEIASSPFKVVVGEWSAAINFCTSWLTNMCTGSGYDNVTEDSTYITKCQNDIASWSGQFKSMLRRFVEVQMDEYERGAGWIFWTYKTESPSPLWDVRLLIDYGVFPQPLSDRRFSSVC
ncbi:glucan 1,3-beta-glucosidase [Schizosaccharomyces japonicus yFS275]|uniref:glucan 1,3-beta-glucosidase n=1 Tax=Schizosaccharomyces japonicus (strain yFS275 / FY16936) TaxID=402676 RepID=B6JZY2_SCHJY|nr:glucan 1,3-beta-glucosidase [Schizosaccharomyces japonicus yFS275]EEB06132.1 glucan 1,3-beta-glucosidase [Schizosaccharomyces japonicus yFS275]